MLIASKNNYHMYKLNQVLTTSKKLIAKSWRKFLTFFVKKLQKFPSPQSGALNSEFMEIGGRGGGIYRHRPNASVSALWSGANSHLLAPVCGTNRCLWPAPINTPASSPPPLQLPWTHCSWQPSEGRGGEFLQFFWQKG